MKRFASLYHMATVLGVMTLLGLGAARAAQAQTAWSSVAPGCVLDSASASRAKTSANFGTVTFKDTSTGTIRLTCPVSVPIIWIISDQAGAHMAMLVNYYDPDGAGTTCQVRAHLLRTNLNELERGLDIVSFDSNTGQHVTEPGTGRSVGFVSIPEDIRSDASYYWVDLELVRNGLSCNPIAVGVYLSYPSIQ
jgi:hypothetical protein